MRIIFSLCAIVAMALPTAADVADYCAAYARDHADQGVMEKLIWQKRYDNALQTCGEQFSLQEPVTVSDKPKKQVARNTPKKPETIAKIKSADEPKPPETKKVASIPNLKSGSQEWVKYCKNKYVSFNEAKGTYLSKTGIERKCLVTAD